MALRGPLAALALVSAALTAVLFLLVLLLVAGWNLSPLAAAITVSVLPLAALAAGRIRGGDARSRAATGCALVGAGTLAPRVPAARLRLVDGDPASARRCGDGTLAPGTCGSPPAGTRLARRRMAAHGAARRDRAGAHRARTRDLLEPRLGHVARASGAWRWCSTRLCRRRTRSRWRRTCSRARARTARGTRSRRRSTATAPTSRAPIAWSTTGSGSVPTTCSCRP